VFLAGSEGIVFGSDTGMPQVLLLGCTIIEDVSRRINRFRSDRRLKGSASVPALRSPVKR
jgi:hypothetical protein